MAIIISGDNTFIADVVNIITKLFCSHSLAKIRFFLQKELKIVTHGISR